MDESLRDAALELVEEREQALVDGDRKAFLATIHPSAKQFARTQARWWENLERLPVTDVSLELGNEDVMTRVHGDGDLQLPIDFTMRLEGYDDHAVTQPLIYTFVGDADEVRLTSDRNIQNDALTGWLPAPWDVAEIDVRETGGVLGVFDQKTRGDAESLMADLVRARDAIEPFVPEWSGRVVAYDISDLDAMDKMSLMEVEKTGGVAFPVLDRPGGRRVAAYRFSVNPSATTVGIQRDLLFRHELVHVALGRLDDSSPTWLREGVAEHVARAVSFTTWQRQRIAATNLEGRNPTLVTSGRFYQRNPTVNYEMAALVTDYLVTTRGAEALWKLMRTLRDDDSLVNQADVEAAVEKELRISTEELSTQALAWARSA
jgi:hypothetical protein